jgi:type I restriction enzyme S subunit
MTGKQLKNSILQWAIQGKLVPQDPNDEPASVLLEKIRAEKARLVKEKKIKKDKNESIIYRSEDNSYYEKFADGTVKCIDDEIPFEIPSTWKWERLINVSQFIIDCPHSTAKDEGIGYPLIRTPNVGFGTLMLTNVHRVSKSVYDKRNERGVPQNGDLIFAREAPAGNIAVIETDEQVCLGQRTVLIRPIDSCVLPWFIAYYILSPDTQKNLVEQSTGTTVSHVNLNTFRPYLIPIPPLSEQRRIIAKLTVLLKIADKYGNEQICLSNLNSSIAESLRKSILQEAIKGKLVPQIASEGTAQELLEQIQQEQLKLVKEGTLKKSTLSSSVIFKGDDNKYYEKVGKDISCIDDELPFGIPNTWSWSRLGNIAQLKLGKTPPRGDSRYWNNGTIPWVSISDMSKEQLITNTKEYISEEAAKDLFQSRISPKGSLLMSFKLSIGKVALLDIDAYHNEAIVTITPYFDNGYAFRDYLMLTLPLLSQLGESKDAIKGKTLNSKSLSNLPIPLSPLTEQLRILAKVMELSKLLKQ